MIDSKIVEVLKTLSKDEMKDLGKMTESSYFVQRKKVAELFKELSKFYPDFNNPSLSDEKVYSRIFPGEKYNEQVLRKLSSELYKLTEELFIRINLQKNYFLEGIFLMDEQSGRGLNKNFIRTSQKLSERIDKKEYGETAFYFAKFLLSDSLINFHIGVEKQHVITREVIEMAEHLITFALIRIVSSHHDKFVNEKAFKLNFGVSEPDIFLDNFNFKNYIETLKKIDSPHFKVMAMRYYLYMALKDYNEHSNYYNLKNFVFEIIKVHDIINVNELRKLRSVCELYIHLGKSEFKEELFSLYDYMLKNIYDKITDMKLPIAEYNSITTLGMDLKKYSTVKKILSKYKDRILDNSRDDAFNLNMATLEFHKGKYESSLDYLNKIKFDSFVKDWYLPKANINNLRLMNYFELNETEPFFSLVDSYKHFLKDNKILSPRLYNTNKQFLDSIEKVYKLRLKNKTDDLAILKQKLSAGENFRNKNWLLKKCL
jgi:hypothetical protein